MAKRQWTAEELKNKELNAYNARTRAELEAAKYGLSKDAMKYGKNFSNVTQRISSSAYAAQSYSSAYTTFKPLVIGVLIFLFFIGPGLSAVLAIFGTLNIWIWVGLILLGLMLWRSAR